MKGIISSYHLSNEIGQKIANIKGMPKAWNLPTLLTKIFDNPAPLFIYDELLLDQSAYEKYCDILPTQERKAISTLVESSKLNIFNLVNVENVLSEEEGDIFEVKVGFNNLIIDQEFIQVVSDIKTHWGNYANPTPCKYEAMNIPLSELVKTKFSKMNNFEYEIVDNIERALLYRISWKKKYSKILSPEIARILVELSPKYFSVLPYKKKWDLDSIIAVRENTHLTDFNNKVDCLTRDATKKLESLFKTKEYPTIYSEETNGVDYENTLTIFLNELQSDIYNQMEDAYNQLQSKVEANKYSILGGILASASSYEGLDNAIRSSLGLIGGGIILVEQANNIIKRKKYGWIEFCEAISKEQKK